MPNKGGQKTFKENCSRLKTLQSRTLQILLLTTKLANEQIKNMTKKNKRRTDLNNSYNNDVNIKHRDFLILNLCQFSHLHFMIKSRRKQTETKDSRNKNEELLVVN